MLQAQDGPLRHALVGLENGIQTILADNATDRTEPTVAVDDEFVYFATGDPSGQWAPMDVSRVAKSGGPVMPLFPAMDVFIDQVLVADDEVFYHQSSTVEIFAVAREGGTPRRVWQGGEDGTRGRAHRRARPLFRRQRAAGRPSAARAYIHRPRLAGRGAAVNRRASIHA